MSNSRIFNAMLEFFEADEWDFNSMDELPVLNMGFSGKNGKWMCYAQAREDQEQFVFYSVCPINTPENRRPMVAEYITRANYGMIIGNFEMDYSDGEVRYKTSIDVEGASLLPTLVKQMVYANVLTMDRYLPGILAVIYGNADPRSEVEKIENPLSSPDDALGGDLDLYDFEDFDGEDDFGDDRNDVNHSNGARPSA